MQPELHRQVRRHAVGHDARHRQRMHPRCAFSIEREVGGIQGGLADDGCDYGGPAMRLGWVRLESGLRHSLPRSDDGDLGAAVQQRQAPRLEMLGRLEAAASAQLPQSLPVSTQLIVRETTAPPSDAP